MLRIKFTNTTVDATTSNVTLNVNSIGAKAIKFHGTQITTNSASPYVIVAGSTIDLVYNGTDFEIVDDGYYRTGVTYSSNTLYITSNK